MKFLHEYLTFGNGTVVDNGWWEIEGCYLYNRNGGRHQYIPKDTDIIVEKDGWDDILKETIRNDSEVTGWIAPDGEFFGCSARNHELIARVLFNSDEIEMEEKGYIKIYEVPKEMLIIMATNGGIRYRYEAIALKSRISEAQVLTLENKGFRQESRTHWIM